MSESKYKVLEVTMNAGDGLLVFTDGIPDSKNLENEFFGHDRLKELLMVKEETCANRVNRLGAELDKFIDAAEQFDDITILALRRL
jgi:serine phosphatase RsbU (regulator of sigma subunit)